jgi:hypothetical protein
MGYNFVPTVKIFEEGPLTVRVYAPPREHRPPHVHVESTNGGEVLGKLGDEDTAPSLWQVHGMNRQDAVRAVRIVEENQEEFLAEWRKYHGA